MKVNTGTLSHVQEYILCTTHNEKLLMSKLTSGVNAPHAHFTWFWGRIQWSTRCSELGIIRCRNCIIIRRHVPVVNVLWHFTQIELLVIVWKCWTSDSDHCAIFKTIPHFSDEREEVICIRGTVAASIVLFNDVVAWQPVFLVDCPWTAAWKLPTNVYSIKSMNNQKSFEIDNKGRPLGFSADQFAKSVWSLANQLPPIDRRILSWGWPCLIFISLWMWSVSFASVNRMA